MDRLERIHVVYANWCPHCVPLTDNEMKRMADELGVGLKLYDIDTDAVKDADNLVKKYGDWSEDYFVPQVFFEFKDGQIRHVFTGYTESLELTKIGLENLFNSQLYKDVKGG